MATIVTRSGKGSPLTNAEVDGNFTNLNTELGTKANTSSLATVATSGAYSDLTGKPTNVSSFSNDSGYITGITSGNVTTALGFTPYNATNPAGYITGITSGNVTTALGYTPANRAGDNFTGAVGFLGGSAVASNGDFYARRDSGSTGVYYFAAGVDKYLYWDGSSYNFGGAGPVIAPTSFRAPIFYDSGDTNYYVDPNSISVLSVVRTASIQRLAGQTILNFNSGTYTEIRDPSGRNALLLGNSGDQANYYDNAAHNFRNVAGTLQVQISGAGTVLAVQDMRSPIFYDSNDTGRYLDPNGTSTLQDVNTVGSLQTYGNIYTREHQYALNAAGTGWNFVIDRNGGNHIVYGQDSVRAPIFYDSDNTAYYINPNGASQVSGANFNFGATGRVYDDGNFHIDGLNSPVWINSIGGSTIELNTQTSGYVNIGNSARAPIFYDSNNTAFYIDPNGSSRLADLTTTGRQTNAAGVKTYSVTTAGQGNNNTRYEIMRISRDSVNWSSNIPYEVTVYSAYYSAGGSTRWSITYGIGDAGTITCMDARGATKHRVYLGAEVVVSGTISYIPVYVDIPNYYGVSIEVKYTTNEVGIFNNSGQVQFTGTYTTGTGSLYGGDIHLVPNGGNVGVGTLSPAGRFHSVSTSGFTAPPLLCTDTVSNFRVVFNTGAYAGVPANKPWLHSYDDIYIGSDANVTTRFMSGGATNLAVASTGIVTAATAFNAPVFNDSVNSAYYIDPDGTTNINRLVIAPRNDNYFVGSMAALNTVTNFQSLTDTYGQMTVMQCNDINGFTNAPTGLYQYGAVMSWRTENHSYQMYASHTGDIAYKTQWQNDNYSGWLTPMVYGRNAGSSSGKTVYGSVFYDSASTGYNVGPSTSSTLANVLLTSTVDSALYTDAALEIRERSFGGVLTTSFNNAPRLAFHWGGRVAMQLALGSDNTLNVMNGDCSGFTPFRAGDISGNVFTDRNNTEYFLDPDNTSNLVGLTVANTITGSVSGTAGSISGFNNPTTAPTANTIAYRSAAGDISAREITLSSGLSAQTPTVLVSMYPSTNQLVRTTPAAVAASLQSSIQANATGTWSINVTGNAATATQLPTAYVGNQQLNPQTYFNSNMGLRVAMTAVAGYWSDTLWINGYSGSDVPNMCALHTSRQATPRMWISSQSSTATSYGTLYEIPVLGYNPSNSNALYAGSFYDSIDTARYFDGNSGINFLTGTSNRVTISSGDSGLYVSNAEGAGAAVRIGAAWNRAGSYSNTSYTLGSESAIYFWISGLEKGYIDSASNLLMNGSVQAPIFYDSDNTGYFINPNGDTNLSKTFTYLGGRDVNANWATGFQNTPPQAYNFHGDISSGGPAGTWWFYESMRHSNASNYWGTQIAWGWEDNSNRLMQRNVSGNSFSAWVEYLSTGGRTYSGNLTMTGSIISSASDVRAPIFYDQNDTSYYVNPNGESVLNTLTVFGELNLSAGTTYVDHSGTIVFRNQANYVNSATLTTGGDFTASGNVTAYSDVRIKDNIETIPNALDKLDLIRGVTYTRTDRDDKERRYAGVIAQEIEKVLPEAIFENEEYKSVDYNATIGLLIQAVKELRDEVEMLRK